MLLLHVNRRQLKWFRHLSASLLRFSMYTKLGGNPGVDPEPLDLGMLRDPSRGTEKCGRGECLEYLA